MRLATLSAPLLVAAALHATYNAVAHGTPWRGGYQLWCGVPYDYFGLVFSPSYVPVNLRALWDAKVPLLAAAGAVVVLARRTDRTQAAADSRRLLAGTVPAIAAITAFHLFYFFPQPRFFLAAAIAAAIVAGGVAGRWLASLPPGLLPGILACILAIVAALRAVKPEALPYRRLAVEEIRDRTPGDAIILSGIVPAYLEELAIRGTRRRAIPLSRRVEYASNLLTPRRVAHPDPAPQGWWDNRCAGLLRGGASQAYPVVASEGTDWIRDELARGVPVFLDTSAADEGDAALLTTLAQSFGSVARSETLFELGLRP